MTESELRRAVLRSYDDETVVDEVVRMVEEQHEDEDERLYRRLVCIGAFGSTH